MRRHRLRALAATVTACGIAVAASACGTAGGQQPSGGDKTLTFAAVPAEQNVDPTEQYDDLAALLEKRTGHTVKVVRSTDYNAVIEGMVSGDIDIAEFGPLSYVLAKQNGAEIAPVAMNSKEGEQSGTYRSVAIAPKDSKIDSLEDFRGKRVCFVDPSSTSGYLFPSASLGEKGIDPRDDVEPVMAGSHDNSVLSVADGKCDAGFAYERMVTDLLIDQGELQEDQLKIVWKSDPIPNSPFVIAKDLPKKVRTDLRTTLLQDATPKRMAELGICESAEKCQLTSDPQVVDLVPTDDATFDPVRRVCETTGNEKCSGSS